MEQSTILAVIVIGLVGFMLFQAYNLSNLKSSLEADGLTGFAGSSNGNGDLPPPPSGSFNDLPQMVGGC